MNTLRSQVLEQDLGHDCAPPPPLDKDEYNHLPAQMSDALTACSLQALLVMHPLQGRQHVVRTGIVVRDCRHSATEHLLEHISTSAHFIKFVSLPQVAAYLCCPGKAVAVALGCAAGGRMLLTAHLLTRMYQDLAAHHHRHPPEQHSKLNTLRMSRSVSFASLLRCRACHSDLGNSLHKSEHAGHCSDTDLQQCSNLALPLCTMLQQGTVLLR